MTFSIVFLLIAKSPFCLHMPLQCVHWLIHLSLLVCQSQLFNRPNQKISELRWKTCLSRMRSTWTADGHVSCNMSVSMRCCRLFMHTTGFLELIFQSRETALTNEFDRLISVAVAPWTLAATLAWIREKLHVILPLVWDSSLLFSLQKKPMNLCASEELTGAWAWGGCWCTCYCDHVWTRSVGMGRVLVHMLLWWDEHEQTFPPFSDEQTLPPFFQFLWF